MKHYFKVGDIVRCISKPFATAEIKVGKEYEVQTIDYEGVYVKTDIENYIYGHFERWEKANKEWDNEKN